MKKLTLHHVLKWVAIIGSLCGVYPILAAAYAFSTKNLPNRETVIWLVIFLVIGGFGYTLSGILTSLEQREKIQAPIRKLICSIAAIGLFVLLWKRMAEATVAIQITTTLLGIFCFLMGTWYVFRDYRDILGEHTLLVSGALNLFLIFLLWCLRLEDSYTYNYQSLIGVFLVSIVCFFIVKNQGNIDHLMERRHHDLSHLPKKIRYYNLALLAGILTVLITAFALRNQLAILLGHVKDWFFAFIAAVIRFVGWLVSLLVNDEPATPEPMEPDTPGMMPGQAGDQRDWTFLLVLIILIALVLLRKPIWRAICSAWNRVRNLFLSFWRRSGKAALNPTGNAYYDDHIEELTHTVKTKEEKKWTKRRFRKEYKAYQSMPQNEQKLYFGYRLIQQWLVWSGHELLPSDTTWRICEKGSNQLASPQLSMATDDYNEVYYGERTCTEEDLRKIDAVLQEASQITVKNAMKQ